MNYSRIRAAVQEALTKEAKARADMPEVPSRTDIIEHPWVEKLESQKEQKAVFLKSTRPATASDYRRWLEGYLTNGGKITHPRGCSFPSSDWYVLERVDLLPPVRGAVSICLIIPVGVELIIDNKGTFDGRGHNQLFYMDGFRQEGGVVEYFDGLIPGCARRMNRLDEIKKHLELWKQSIVKYRWTRWSPESVNEVLNDMARLIAEHEKTRAIASRVASSLESLAHNRPHPAQGPDSELLALAKQLEEESKA